MTVDIYIVLMRVAIIEGSWTLSGMAQGSDCRAQTRQMGEVMDLSFFLLKLLNSVVIDHLCCVFYSCHGVALFDRVRLLSGSNSIGEISEK